MVCGIAQSMNPSISLFLDSNASLSFPKITFYIKFHIRSRGRKEMSHNDHVALSDYLFSTMILDFFSSVDLFVVLFTPEMILEVIFQQSALHDN